MDSMFGNTYLMSYATEVTKKASLQVVTVSSAAPNAGTIADTKTTDYTIAELITLDTDTGLFVGITQDVDDDLATSYVVAGAVNKATSKISTLTQSIVYGGNYSVTPAIVRLSATSFAIGYYNDTQISTRYGTFPMTHIGHVCTAHLHEIHEYMVCFSACRCLFKPYPGVACTYDPQEKWIPRP